MTGRLLISAHILYTFQRLQSFRKWDKGVDIYHMDRTSYTTQHQEAFLQSVENGPCTNHRCLPVTIPERVLSNNLFYSATAPGSGQSLYDSYDLYRGDEEYLMPKNVAKTTPRPSNCAAPFLTAARLYLNSPPELPQDLEQMNPNHNHYHSDPIEISSTFWIADITDWWRQQDKTHSKNTYLSNVALNILDIIPHGVAVQPSVSIGRDVIGWRWSKTTGETLCETVVVSQFSQANNRLLAGDNPAFDMINADNDLAMKREAQQKKLHK